ncbi:MAG TPA: methylated-DNA--[protein]-cysteine S-methyltransferase [Longimicrobiales bacterium]|nr:methylated-DNA--[protein]-cysteine S-methyltransferase [Longimicrobiales bacterium]
MNTTIERTLPPADEMYGALLARDTRYDGIFFTAVRTTGIFCRPTCPAKKPDRRNVDFFASARAALAHGFRPCLRCRPMEPPGATPEPIRLLLAEIERAPMNRLRDADLRARGLEPAALRRWFRTHHGMTFQAYHRALRLSRALGQLASGADITRAAFDNGYDSLSGFQDALRQITGRSPARSRNTTVVHLSRVLTPLGPMLLGTADEQVCILEFTDRRMLETQLTRLSRKLGCAFLPGSTDVSRRMEGELAEYFAGERRVFETPVATPGTDFQQRVWAALREIPFGTVRSYGEQARAIGEPNAVRAVARANGDNRIAIVIPCHRVIGADGTLTGYGGGLWRKQWLLEHEGWTSPGTGSVTSAQTELL